MANRFMSEVRRSISTRYGQTLRGLTSRERTALREAFTELQPLTSKWASRQFKVRAVNATTDARLVFYPEIF